MLHYALAQKKCSVAALFSSKECSVSAFVAYFCYSAFSGKSGRKPLKISVAQRSGPFLAAHMHSVSGVMAEFRYATLRALTAIPLCYATLTTGTTVSVATHC
jgi:uncharacterized protein YbbC (DUF1343 family)